MEIPKLRVSDAKNDLENLISCIKCHEDTDNVVVIKEALKTVVAVCSNCNDAKDDFRELGGLDFILHFMCTTESVDVLESCLKTLACVMDENVYNQKELTKRPVLELIHRILANSETSSHLLINTIFFSSTLMFQNSGAQMLARETGCLTDFIYLYQNSFPTFMIDKNASEWDVNDVKHPSIEVWQAVNTVLCFAVNNPQNEENQRQCAPVFPLALKVLQSSSHHNIIHATSAFLALTIANNRQNQDMLSEYDGLLVLKQCLHKGVSSLMKNFQEYHNVISKGNIQASISVISVIDVALSDHEQNSQTVGKLGTISLMLKLLSIDTLDEQLKIKIILTLGHCIDVCGANRIYLLEEETFPELLKINMLSGEKDLQTACKYLLQACLRDDNQTMEKSPIPKEDKTVHILPSVNQTASDIKRGPVKEIGSDEGSTFSLSVSDFNGAKLSVDQLDCTDKAQGMMELTKCKQHSRLCHGKILYQPRIKKKSCDSSEARQRNSNTQTEEASNMTGTCQLNKNKCFILHEDERINYRDLPDCIQDNGYQSSVKLLNCINCDKISNNASSHNDSCCFHSFKKIHCCQSSEMFDYQNTPNKTGLSLQHSRCRNNCLPFHIWPCVHDETKANLLYNQGIILQHCNDADMPKNEILSSSGKCFKIPKSKTENNSNYDCKSTLLKTSQCCQMSTDSNHVRTQVMTLNSPHLCTTYSKNCMKNMDHSDVANSNKQIYQNTGLFKTPAAKPATLIRKTPNWMSKNVLAFTSYQDSLSKLRAARCIQKDDIGCSTKSNSSVKSFSSLTNMKSKTCNKNNVRLHRDLKLNPLFQLNKNCTTDMHKNELYCFSPFAKKDYYNRNADLNKYQIQNNEIKNSDICSETDFKLFRSVKFSSSKPSHQQKCLATNTENTGRTSRIGYNCRLLDNPIHHGVSDKDFYSVKVIDANNSLLESRDGCHTKSPHKLCTINCNLSAACAKEIDEPSINIGKNAVVDNETYGHEQMPNYQKKSVDCQQHSSAIGNVNDFNSVYVIKLSGQRCSKHKLLMSSEMLNVIPFIKEDSQELHLIRYIWSNKVCKCKIFQRNV